MKSVNSAAPPKLQGRRNVAPHSALGSLAQLARDEEARIHARVAVLLVNRFRALAPGKQVIRSLDQFHATGVLHVVPLDMVVGPHVDVALWFVAWVLQEPHS